MNKFFRCDDCGREVNGITNVNGMNFCAKCYQETFGNTTDTTKLQEIWREQFEKGWRLNEYINELKQQLAEKEKLINELLQPESEIIKTGEDAVKIHKDFILLQNQQAIEELNAILEKLFIGKCKTYYDVQRDMYVMGDRDRAIVDYINERIKALKGEE